MLRKLRLRISDDAGAVTVDWVVLTAAVVAMNIGVIVNYFQSAMIEGSSVICEQTAGAVDGSVSGECEPES